MPGSSASSSNRCSGRVSVRVALEDAPTPEAIELVEGSLTAFVESIAAGYFFPAALRSPQQVPGRPTPTTFELAFDVQELPLTAMDVLGGVLHLTPHRRVDRSPRRRLRQGLRPPERHPTSSRTETCAWWRLLRPQRKRPRGGLPLGGWRALGRAAPAPVEDGAFRAAREVSYPRRYHSAIPPSPHLGGSGIGLGGHS